MSPGAREAPGGHTPPAKGKVLTASARISSARAFIPALSQPVSSAPSPSLAAAGLRDTVTAPRGQQAVSPAGRSDVTRGESVPAPRAHAKGTRAPALGPAGTPGKQNEPGGQQGRRSHFREPLQHNFVFRGRGKRAEVFVIHQPPVLSTACSSPPLLFPFPPHTLLRNCIPASGQCC